MTSAPSYGAGCGWRGISVRPWESGARLTAAASRRGGFVLLHFLQQLLDALGVFLGLVQCEAQFGRAPKLQTLDEFPPDVSRRVLHRLDGRGLLFSAAAHAHKHM